MSRLPAPAIGDLPQATQALLRQGEELMGFVPNDGLAMARHPALLTSMLELVRSVYAPGKVDAALKRMIGLVASRSAQCNYCVAHTANAAARLGVSPDKLNALCDFDNDDAFDARERAALAIARGAAAVPNAVSDEDYALFARYFDADQQVEIVAVIALFGFLNRWNATLKTELEPAPAAALSALRGAP